MFGMVRLLIGAMLEFLLSMYETDNVFTSKIILNFDFIYNIS